MNHSNRLDLTQAAELVRTDFARSFLFFLHDWELFEAGRAIRLQHLRSRLDSYQAKPTRQITIPKSSLLSRPGALPTIDDWVVYTALTAAIAGSIEHNLIAPEQKVVFSFRWDAADPDRSVKYAGLGYNDYRTHSLELLDDYKYVVESDITAYFENIDPTLLQQSLLRLNAEETDVNMLVNGFLTRWTHDSKRGLPQGPWASSYLGNAYLDQLDKGMIQSGYRFARFMDDFRVFCSTATEARKAVLTLSELARELGLSIQSSKTRVLSRAQARRAWRGYQDWLDELGQDVREAVKESFVNVTPYGPDEQPSEPEGAASSVDVLYRMFDLITAKPAYKLDRKGLKFVLAKLEDAGDCYARGYCLAHLVELPDVAPDISSYLASCGNSAVCVAVADFVSSEELVYDWHAAHLIYRMCALGEIDQALVEAAFTLACDENRDAALRSTCVDLIAEHGSYEQVKTLTRLFKRQVRDDVRAAIILATRRMHPVERQSFLGGCRGLAADLDSAIGKVWSLPKAQHSCDFF